jgi:arabinose-5-phosphate isomerase
MISLEFPPAPSQTGKTDWTEFCEADRAGAMNMPKSAHVATDSALRTVRSFQDGLSAVASALEDGLSAPFTEAVRIMHGITGRVIVTGVGKSGHIGSKLAATLASTGTPAFFVHPAEANHGDLGMIAKDDVIISMSWSGETAELKGILSYSRRYRIPLIAITSGEKSTLAREADVVLRMPKVVEACPHGLAPTTSTMMQLAIGDALAIALLEARGFTAGDFHKFHPGGTLGAALTHIGEIMHKGERIPLVASGTKMRDAIIEISTKGFGCVGITNADGTLAGIITDGDLRRHIGKDLLSVAVDDVMTRNPKTVPSNTLVAKALDLVNASKITALMIVGDGRPVGIVHLHDLLRVGAA